jgi:S1-C subfamily serine protease
MTDSPVNPGQSGGTLLNLYGQVIGLNAAIATESGVFEGIGFTMPNRMAAYIANPLMTRQGRAGLAGDAYPQSPSF